ncbi:MAG: GNAT family N-acetyltransferase [Verrucomicrobia bacterium]|nr:GNAT family N-acetyltransferase [Verrucomicrobiota bacterium]MBV9130551.1 GNAT family N-acetyltransferase [Verrucomicrobiota bacterium]
MQEKMVDNLPVAIAGSLFKVARLRHEPYECANEPVTFIDKFRKSGVKADLFTFLQEISEPIPKYDFHLEWSPYAVIPLTTYDHWFKKQIDCKTRNMVRKSRKAGVETRVIDFDDEFVRGVMGIYDESPFRQGKPFIHYKKDFETLKRELSTFFDRSEFAGAYYEGELIGFIKYVRGNKVASLMHIIAKIAHRDKAPTNALIAKAVEMCEERGIANLHYGVWSRRGLGLFKTSHGFICRQVPRYFVPLTLKGELALNLRLHRRLRDYIPERWADRMVSLRSKWNALRYRNAGAAQH